MPDRTKTKASEAKCPYWEAEDRKAFNRLREYYRKHFKNGDSDEAFLLWCESMIAEIANA